MCGRYLIEIDDDVLQDIVRKAEMNITENLMSTPFRGGEIFPTNIVPAVSAGREVSFRKWGIHNFYNESRPHINARSETVAEKKTFADSFINRRCLIPASGYYEWKKIGKNEREKYIFTLPDRMMMYMAGIYTEDGNFAILTRKATESIYPIHDRMPVIIPHKYADEWLMESPNVIDEALTDIEFASVDTGSMSANQMSLFS